MLKMLVRFLFGTLRGRLIVGVAVVHAVMMALFIADLTVRQRGMLRDLQVADATARSRALAASAAGWIVADDIAGLQEIVEGQRCYPEVLFAILADKDGRVLADTEKSRRGLYLLDLPRETTQKVFCSTPSLVDIAAPAMVEGRHVGWARVGTRQRAAGEKLAEITRGGVMYALAAIAIGSLIAWFMGRRLTRRLYVVQQTIDAVRSGNRLARAPIAGIDEAAVMAREFNFMLDAVAERDIELSASEEKYRTLFEESFDGIFITCPVGRFLDINKKAIAILGYDTKEEVFRLDVERDVYAHPPDRRRMLAIVDAQGIAEYEVPFKKKGGQEIIAYCSLTAVKDGAGTVNSYRGILRDITERKRAESVSMARLRLLQIAETHSLDELLEATLNEAEELTHSIIGFYHFLEADQKTLSLQNWSTRTKAEHCVAEGKGRHYSVADAGVWVDCVRQLRPVIHNDLASLLHRKGFPTGHASVVRELVVPVFRGEKIVAILGVGNKPQDYFQEDVETVSLLADLAWEIAERKRVEETDRRLALIVESSDDAIIAKTLDGVISSWNAGAEGLYGYSAIEVLGKPVSILLPPENTDELPEILGRLRRGERISHYETTRIRKDGQRLQVSLSVSPLLDGRGKVVGASTIARDVTDRKRFEEKLQLMQAQLAHMARLSTAGEMVASIAHEVNKPLYTLMNYAKACSNLLAAEHPDLGELREWNREIASGASRAGEIINRLIGFVRRTELQRVPANIREMIDESAAIIASEVHDGRLTLGMHLEDVDLTVLVDRIQIQQVLVNLLRNACQACKESGTDAPQVMIRTTLTQQGVEVSVGDNGIGLPEPLASRLFQPFFTTKPDGLGMGLAISKTIIEAHGGRIWATANPGPGATFHFTLPRSETEASDA